MKLQAVELRRVELQLVAPFQTSFGTEVERDILLLRVETSVGEGWGECCALAAPLYSSEYVDGVQQVLVKHILPRLFAAGEISAEGVVPLLGPVVGHHMAKAVIEMAILDAELRAQGRSFGDRLGSARPQIDCGVSVGIAAGIGELLETVGGYLTQGYRRVKLKIKPGWDVDPVAAVRKEFGDAVPLQVDANTAYTLADADHLARLDEFGLLLIEQPLPEDQVLNHAKLARRLKTPICLDESITSARGAADAIELGACSVVNIKPARVGGYLEAVRVHDVCLERGVPVWCGGMLESGLGRAGNVALAALPGFTLPGDVSGSDRYYKRDLTEPFVMRDGRLDVPTGPGLGVTVDQEMLDSVTRSSELVRAG